jgi:hypothetical protein
LTDRRIGEGKEGIRRYCCRNRSGSESEAKRGRGIRLEEGVIVYCSTQVRSLSLSALLIALILGYGIGVLHSVESRAVVPG